MSIAEVQYDPFCAQMFSDPYPTYRWLRENAPVQYSPQRELWAVSRHEDVIEVTRDWATFSSACGADTDELGSHFIAPGSFLDTDPELHDKLRAVVHRPFTPKVLRARAAPIVQAVVAARLDALAQDDLADLAQDFAWPLAAGVIAELLGLPSEDLPRVQPWGENLARRVPGIAEPPAAAITALVEITEYLREMLARRRGGSGDDLLSSIANAHVDGAPIGDEAAGIATLLLMGGVETIASAIGNALLLLAEHPDQRAWLAAHPEAIPQALDEIVRFESPIQHVRRITTRDVEMHGETIPRGSHVVIVYGSANRDERRYEHAERFDIHRERKRSLAFGDGIHHCLGVPLARLEGEIVLGAILRELPDYELAGEPERCASHMNRSIQRLPIRQNRR
jgi:cytochrome P450